MDDLLLLYAVYFIVNILVEYVCTQLALGLRFHRLRVFGTVFIENVITHPAAWTIMYNAPARPTWWAWFLTVEGTVFIVEAFLSTRLLRNLGHKPSRLAWATIFANLTTALMTFL